jgi:hypothetical protein
MATKITGTVSGIPDIQVEVGGVFTDCQVYLSPVVDEASSTGATFSTLTNPDGDGKNYRLASFTTAGTHTLAATTGGIVQALAVSGGSAGHNIGINVVGGPGDVREGTYHLPSGNVTVTVGAGGVGTNGTGGASSIGTVVVCQGAAWGVNPYDGSVAGWFSSITGSSQEYATVDGGNSVPGHGGSSGSGSGVAGVVYIRWEI